MLTGKSIQLNRVERKYFFRVIYRFPINTLSAQRVLYEYEFCMS